MCVRLKCILCVSPCHNKNRETTFIRSEYPQNLTKYKESKIPKQVPMLGSQAPTPTFPFVNNAIPRPSWCSGRRRMLNNSFTIFNDEDRKKLSQSGQRAKNYSQCSINSLSGAVDFSLLNSDSWVHSPISGPSSSALTFAPSATSYTSAHNGLVEHAVKLTEQQPLSHVTDILTELHDIAFELGIGKENV